MGDKGQKNKDRMRKQHIKEKEQKATDKKARQTKETPLPKAR
jgi:hypothetical protein